MTALKKARKSFVKKLSYLLFAGLFLSFAGSMNVQANSGEANKSSGLQQSVRTVKGTVKDREGNPLIGVSVTVRGTSVGTITDIDGKFSINAQSDQTINFTYVGFKSVLVTADKTDINIIMEEDSQLMDEVVVVGYGVQKKENLTGAVSSVDVGKAVDSRPISDVGRALQGAVPGLTISTKSGEIGGAPDISIRGNVISPNGTAKPLILLDNVEISDITLVNPDDIESISVLKDAASASIYGVRAAAGVILITTKSKSKHERFSVSYSNNFAWRTPTVKPEQLPAWQQGEINLAGIERTGKNSYTIVGNMNVNAQTIQKMKEWEQQYGDGKGLGSEMVYGRDFEIDADGTYYYRSWDWYDMYIKDWMPQQTHNLAINGGNGTTNYNISLGYLHQEGLTKSNPDTYDRYNTMLSLNTQATKWLNIRGNVIFTKTDMDKPMIYANDLYDHMYYLYRWQPVYPYGTLDGKPFRSALTELENVSMTRRKKEYARYGIGTTVNIIEGLTFDFDFMYSTLEERYKKSGGQYFAYNTFGSFKSLDELKNSYGNQVPASYDFVYEDRGRTQMLTTNAYATYEKKLKEHSFKVMMGANLESSKYNYISAQRMGLYDFGMPELNQATGNQLVNGSHTHWAVAGFFGRINYAYKDRYLLEMNGRYDGSSKFPKNDRFGFFPSVSVGYRISEEDFMKSLYPALSSFKFRGSYGTIGYQNVSNNMYLETMKPNASYSWIIDGQQTVAMGTPKVVSASLGWEKVTTIDVGFDARLWDDKIGVTFDWYKRTTSDLLSKKIVPLTLGVDGPLRNFGKLETPGWELAVDFRHQFSNGLTIILGGQLTDYYTKVTKWDPNTEIPAGGNDGRGWAFDTRYYREGMKLGDIWGLKVDRLLQESDFENGQLKQGLPNQDEIFGSIDEGLQPGDVLYKDLNGDKKITRGTSMEDVGDRTVIGNMFPRYQYGFTIGAEFKGFDFNMFFQGVGKRNLWAGGNQVLPGYTSGEPYYKGAEDYWTPENPNAFYPRPTIYGQGAKWNYEVNDRYILNMAYLRCKTLTVGYTFPKPLIEKAFLKTLRVYFTAENLFTFDNVKPAIDPEIDIRYITNANGTNSGDTRNFGRSYPQQRTLSFGLQATF